MQRGDDGFTSFVRARRPALVRLGWALTGDRQRGEDLAQASFDRLWTRWDRVSATGDPWPYVQRIAVSQASSWRRRRWLRAELPSSTPPELGGADEFGVAENRVVVEAWLRALPPRQRAVITLRFLSDLSVDETATVLQCTSGTVKSQTSKALDTLRSNPDAAAFRQTGEPSHD